RLATLCGCARIDRFDQAKQSVLAILLLKAGDLGADRLLCLPLDEIGGREIDENEQRQYRRREQRHVERGQTERVGTQEAIHAGTSAFSLRANYNRRREWFAKARDRSRGRSCGAGG